MNFLNNLKIVTRLKLILGIMAAMLFGMAGLAYWQMNVMNASTHEITSNWLPSVELINAMNTNTSDFRIGQISHVLSTDDKEMAATEKEIAAVKADFDKNHDGYVKLISSEEERKIYESFATDWKLYLQMHERLIEMSRKRMTEEARALLDKESKPVYDSFTATLMKLIELNHNGSVAESKTSEGAYTTARNAMVVAAVLGLALVGQVLYLVSQNTALVQMATSTADAAPSPLATQLFTVYLLPFEITSILLLVAMVGAIVLTKQDKKGARG